MSAVVRTVTNVVEDVVDVVEDVVTAPVDLAQEIVDSGFTPLSGDGGGILNDIVDVAGDVVSGAVDIVEDIGGEIIDVAEDAVEWVGDAISDVADFAYNEILQPVGNFVEGYVQGMLDDPIVTAAKITALATGQAWAIPLIDGAATLIEGGDFEDVLTSVAISYATQTIGAEFGDIAGEFVGDAVGDAVSSEVAREVVTKAVGSGTQNAFSALLYGTDPIEAFATGGLSAAINATSAKVVEEIGFEFKTPKKDSNGNIIKDSSGKTIFEESPIPSTVMKVVGAGVKAALTGQEITPELIAGAVAEGVLTMDLVKSTGAELGIDFSVDSPELTYIAAGLQRVASIAVSGGSGEQAAAAFKATLDAYGSQALVDVVKNSDIGDIVSDTIDKMSGDYQKVTGIVDNIDAEAMRKSEYISEYESKRNELNADLAEIDSLRTLITTLPTGTTAEQNAYDQKVAELNEKVSAFDTKFTQYNPRLDELRTAIEISDAKLETLGTNLTAAQQDLQRSMDRLDDDLVPLTGDLVKATVSVMDPNFIESDYRRINKLGNDVNVYEHFIANATNPNVFTSYAQYDAAVDRNTNKVINQALSDANIDIASVDKDILKQLYTDISEGLGKFSDAGEAALADTGTMQFYTNIAYEVFAGAEDNPYRQATLNPELRGRLESLGFDMDGVMGGEPLNDAEKAALYGQDQQKASPNTAKLGSGVTWDDVVDNKATISVDSDGNRTWVKNQVKTYDMWDPTYGRVTVKEYNGGVTGNTLGTTLEYTDGEGNVVFTVANIDTPIGMRDKAEALSHVSAAEKERFMSAAKNMGLSEEQARFAIRMMERAQNTNDSEYINVAANIMRAGGGILQNFSNVATLWGKAGSDTALGKFADKLVKLGEATNTDTYKSGVNELKADMNKNGATYQAAYDKAKAAGKSDEQAKAAGIAAQKAMPWYERAFEKVETLAGAIKDQPGMFIAEYVGVEGAQELVPLAIGGVAALGAKGAVAMAGRQLSSRIAAKAGLGAAATSDLAESYGGAAGEAYDRAYQLAKNSGMSEDKAKEYALDLAVRSGTVAATMTALTMGAGGLALEKAILNKDVVGGKLANGLDALVDRIEGTVTVVLKETGSEAAEEGIAQLYTLAHLQELDPDIDIPGEASAAAFLGAVISAKVTTGALGVQYTGDILSNLNSSLNPEVQSIIQNTPDTAEGLAQAAEAFTSMGITGSSQIDLLNSIANDNYVSTGEARNRAIQSGYDQGYTFNEDDINNFVGAANDNNTAEAISNYANVRATTTQEVIDRAASEGYTLSAADAQEFVGQGGANFEANTLGNVALKYDPLATTSAEVEQRFQELGFNVNNSDVTQFVKAGNENDTLAEIDAYVDPRQVTEAEARKFFTDLGFEPDDAQVQQFIGQGGADFQSTTGTNVASYVDPRQVTEAEARQFFADQNYTPSNEQVQNFVGQGGANFQTNTGTNVASYVDPRQVTEAEARQYFADLGFEPTREQLDQFIGAYTPENLTTDVIRALRMVTGQREPDLSYDINGDGAITISDVYALARGEGGANFQTNTGTNVASYVDPRQVTEAEARQYFASQNYTPSNEEIQNFVGQGGANFQTNTGTNVASYVDPRQVTEAEARQYFADQNYTPSNEEVQNFIGQGGANFQSTTGTNVASYVDPRQLTEQEVRGLYTEYNYDPSAEELSQFVGQGDQTFQETAPSRIYEYVDPRQVTNEEARQFFADLNYDASDAEIASFVAQVEQTTQAENIAKYVDPRQVTMDELQAIANEEGITLTEALAQTYIGQGGADFQASQLAAARKEYDPLATTMDEVAEFFAATNYTATPEEMAAFVASKTEETQRSAISAYVNPRQVTEAEATQFFADLGYAAEPEEIAQFVGQLNDDTYQQTQLTNVGAYVDPRMVDITEVQDFISGLGVDLSKAREEDINRLIGQYDESLLADRVQEALPVITSNMLTDELTAVQNLLGKPGQEITQADIDFLTSSIASNIVLNEQQTAQYDVNADGVVDAADQTLLQQAFTGTPVSFAETSVYAPTGMYKTLQDQRIQSAAEAQALSEQLTQQAEANTQAQQELQANFEQQLEQQQQMTQDLVTQTAIDTQTAIQQEAAAQRNKEMYRKMLTSPGYSITSNQVDPAKIDYIYDFSSIFANPQQAALYGTPFGYREGGQIDATTDKLLRIIGGS